MKITSKQEYHDGVTRYNFDHYGVHCYMDINSEGLPVDSTFVSYSLQFAEQLLAIKAQGE